MIALQVKASGTLEADMEQFGNHAPKLVDKVIRIVAYRYRKSIKENYLSGQYLGEWSGDLKKSLVAGRPHGRAGAGRFIYLVGSKSVKDKKSGLTTSGSVKLASIYEHVGGYTIKPKNAKALRFMAADGSLVFTKSVHGRERHFMIDSAKSFNWTQAFAKTEEEVIGKEIKKLQKEGAYVPGGLD